jgi:WD40-like Beta Propeller Repeat
MRPTLDRPPYRATHCPAPRLPQRAAPALLAGRAALAASARLAPAALTALLTALTAGCADSPTRPADRLPPPARPALALTLSPADGQIAFQSNRDGNNEIYVMNADGTDQTRLTNNSAADQEPAWTPIPAVTPFSFTGFFQPVDNAPTVNKAKAGGAIPVKFSLGGDRGLAIFLSGFPKFIAAPCDGGAEDAIETTTAGASGLTYDAVTDTYTYVWKTDKAWAGKCGTLELGLTDGSSHTAEFTFTK